MMLAEISSHEIDTERCPLHPLFTGSATSQEPQDRDMWEDFISRPFAMTSPQKAYYPYRRSQSPFEIDASSTLSVNVLVVSYGEFSGESSLPEEAASKPVEEEVEHEVVVRMGPHRRYTRSVYVRGIKRAVPKVVEPHA